MTEHKSALRKHDHPRPFCGIGCPAFGDAIAAYPPKCDHAMDCICIEASHRDCCGALRDAVLNGLLR